MGDEPMNALNTNVVQRGKINEQHQNVGKLGMEKSLTALSTTHQEIPQIITQSNVVNVHNDDNHELVQPFDAVIYV